MAASGHTGSAQAKDPVFQLCDVVRETGYALHGYLRHGHQEKVYENGMVHRLRKRGLAVEQQTALEVHDEDGTLLGTFFADLLIERMLVVELKACRNLSSEHTAQLLGYLRAARMRHGLLLNFGTRFQIRKYVLTA